MIRYVLVGSASFALDLGLLVLFREVVGAPVWAAASVAFLLTLAFTFMAHRRWSFRGHAAPAGPQVWRYLVLVGVNLVITAVTVEGLAQAGLDYRAAKVLATGVVVCINYAAFRWWVFQVAPPE